MLGLGSLITSSTYLLDIIRSGLKLSLPFTISQQFGEELITNGDFSDGTNNWSFANGSELVNGAARINNTVTGLNSYIITGASNDDPTGVVATVGKVYKFKYDVTITNTKPLVIEADSSSDNVSLDTSVVGTNKVVYFVFNKTGGRLAIKRLETGTDVTLDNISLKEVGQFSLDETTLDNNAKLFTGNALNFDGVNDRIEVASHDAINLGTSDFTVAFWINKLAAGSGDQKIIDKNHGNAGYTIYINNSNEVILQLRDDPFNNTQFSLGTIPDDVYQRVVISADRSGNATCYINNVAQTPVNISSRNGNLDNTANLFIGADTPSGGSDLFSGKLADVQLWNVAWSATNVNDDFVSPNQLVSSIPVANLKAWWAMTEGSGSVAYDSSGQSGAQNGAIDGATYVTKQSSILQLGMINWSNDNGVFLPPNPTNPTHGITGVAVRERLNSLNLTGTGYAEIADDDTLDFGTGTFSVECWAKADYVNKSSGINTILTLGGAYAALDSVSFHTNSSNTKFRVTVSNFSLDANSTYVVGRWYHLCVTRNSSNLCTFYVDSVAQDDTETTSNSITNANVKYIGRDSQVNRFYSNLINDIRIYNVELTADQVKQNYNAGTSAHAN